MKKIADWYIDLYRRAQGGDEEAAIALEGIKKPPMVEVEEEED